MGLDPWTGRPAVLIPPQRPEFYDVWLDAPSSECGWGDIKPFSLETISSMTNQCKTEKSKSRSSRLFSRPRDNKSESSLGSSVDGVSINENAIPPSLQLSVFIAMPSPKSEKGEQENQMTVGLVTVPYNGQT
ncbi:hypothetical protein BDZ89DRAFT_1075984 [Hymenopellis radicata]|nr:hypothetical protein BDZ89DRAFT_1075984 [Hymenopellis radicata]